jgi:hypothetical protein
LNLRNVIIVAAAFGLLAVSLTGISYNRDNKTNVSSEISGGLIAGTKQSIPTMAEPEKAKPQDSSSQPSSPTNQTAPAPPNSNSNSATSSKNLTTLAAQVQESGHYKLFPTMVKKGPSIKDPQGEHYEDDCIRCHSAVKRLDDPQAKLDDFFTGGKYANQTEGISCRVCHVSDDDYELRQSGWESCGTCHVNSSGNPIPGMEVHHPQFQMIQGVAIGDILPMPSYKYKYMKDSFTCTNCHVTNSTKHDYMVPGVTVTHDSEGIRRESTTMDYQQFKAIFQQPSCDVCHPSTNETVNRVREMQTVIGTKLDELEPIYEEWNEKIKTLDPNDPRVMTFKNGATYYTFVYSDGSKGVHNFPYAKLLLEKAEMIWRELQLK